MTQEYKKEPHPPGLNIFQNDDAGLQLNIGGRGLDPNRTSNFNTRQNGYDISAATLSTLPYSFDERRIDSMAISSCHFVSIGLYGPMNTFFELPLLAKWWASFLMLLGRLELFTVLIVFTPYFWSKR